MKLTLQPCESPVPQAREQRAVDPNAAGRPDMEHNNPAALRFIGTDARRCRSLRLRSGTYVKSPTICDPRDAGSSPCDSAVNFE